MIACNFILYPSLHFGVKFVLISTLMIVSGSKFDVISILRRSKYFFFIICKNYGKIQLFTQCKFSNNFVFFILIKKEIIVEARHFHQILRLVFYRLKSLI